MASATGTISLTLTQASEAVNISLSVLREAIKRGELTVRYPSTTPVVRVADLDDYVANLPTERPAKKPARL